MTDAAVLEAFVRRVYGDDPTGESWWAQALCAQTDPEAFFPEKGGSTREAKKICASCDVRDECLAWALDTDQRHGIWGGKSTGERKKLRAPRAPGTQAAA